jgi:hypothetical protein
MSKPDNTPFYKLTLPQKRMLRFIHEEIVYGDYEMDNITDEMEYYRVKAMLSLLSDKGLIYEDDYGDYRLTELGERAVAFINRKG